MSAAYNVCVFWVFLDEVFDEVIKSTKRGIVYRLCSILMPILDMSGATLQNAACTSRKVFIVRTTCDDTLPTCA